MRFTPILHLAEVQPNQGERPPDAARRLRDDDRHIVGFAGGWVRDGSAWFYEINGFVESGWSIESRVKCFSGDLADREGWSEYVRHRLIKVTNGVMYFDSISPVQEGPEHYTVYSRIPDGEKKGQILVVHQTWVPKR